MWRNGRASESKSENLGSRPGDVAFETNQFCRTSSTFVKVCRKSSIFIVKSSAGMSKTFFDTCMNWSCVTRCGCRTTSSTLFTVYVELVYAKTPENSPHCHVHLNKNIIRFCVKVFSLRIHIASVLEILCKIYFTTVRMLKIM